MPSTEAGLAELRMLIKHKVLLLTESHESASKQTDLQR